MGGEAQAALIGAVVGAVSGWILQLLTSHFATRNEKKAVARSIVQDLEIVRESLDGLYADASSAFDEKAKRRLGKFRPFEPINLSNAYKIAPSLSEQEKEQLASVRTLLADCETAKEELIEDAGAADATDVAAYWSSVQALITRVDAVITRLSKFG